jgi:Sulfotransferase domain
VTSRAVGSKRRALRYAVKKRLLPVLPYLSAGNVRAHEVFEPVVAPVSDFIQRRHLGPDDVLLASYPRSGNTWLRFLLFELLTGESPEYAKVRKAIPLVNYHKTARPLLASGGRIIKTHEPFHRAYAGKRAIYMVRDSRDVAVSEHRYRTRNGAYLGDMDSFCEDFARGRVQRFGSWAQHVESWLDGEPARHGRLLLVKFEDMRRDTHACLRAVLDFLDVEKSDGVIDAAIESNSLKRMRAKEDHTRRDSTRENRQIFRAVRSDLRFVNQGAVGGWHKALSDQQVIRIEGATNDVLARLGYSNGARSLETRAR